ncbi:MAG: hypothetical protein EB034_04960, partial [Verrucomicrobia bacterium]|nr:hypothetical protein [Verrucomicrobiota bacterium]
MKTTIGLLRVAAVALVIAVSSHGTSIAQAQQQQPAQQIAALLAANPNGGEALAAAIRQLLVANPNAYTAVMAALQNASASQLNAIGAGLGQAVAALRSAGNGQAATAIQTAVASAAG